MNFETVPAPVVYQALPDLGLAGVVLLIVACGILVLAFSRSFRTAVSVTLAIAFVMMASGWIFQIGVIGGARSPAGRRGEGVDAPHRMSQRAVSPHDTSPHTMELRPGHDLEAAAIEDAGETSPRGAAASDSADRELLRVSLDNASPEVAVYKVQSSLPSGQGDLLIDGLIEAASAEYKFSLATGDQRIYARTEPAEGSDAPPALQGFVLTELSARATFEEPPSAEQLARVAKVVKAITEAAQLDAQPQGDWSGKGVARTLALRAAPDPAIASPAGGSSGNPRARLGKLSLDTLLQRNGGADRSAGSEPPAWIALADQPGQLVDGAYVVVASSGRFLTTEQCEPSLQQAIAGDVGNYVRMRLGEEAAQLVTVPQKLIDEQIVHGSPVEEAIASSTVEGGGKRLHTLLVFDQKVQEDLKSLYREAQIERRSLLTVAMGAAVLLMIGVVYGYLKVDTATGGAYTKRLRAAAVLGLALAGAGLTLVIRAANIG